MEEIKRKPGRPRKDEVRVPAEVTVVAPHTYLVTAYKALQEKPYSEASE